MSLLKTITSVLLIAVLTACGGGGGDASKPVTVTVIPSVTTSVVAISSLLLSAPNPVAVNADGSSSIEVTVRALDSSGGLIPNVPVSLSAPGAILSATSVTTDVNGQAKITLVANPSNQTSRTVTVTANCGVCLAPISSLDIAVKGSMLTLSSPSGQSLLVGDVVTLTATLRDANNTPVVGVPVTFLSSNSNALSVNSVTQKTAIDGTITATVTALAQTSGATVTAATLGIPSTLTYSVSVPTGGPLSVTTDISTITALPIAVPNPNNYIYVANLTVLAPGAITLDYSASDAIGALAISPTSGVGSSFKGSATFSSSQTGTVTITVVDSLGRQKSVILQVTPPTADKIILSASQTSIGVASATNTATLRITATATKNSNGSDQPVVNLPIQFSMTGGVGGAYITPAQQSTDTFGKAYVDFYPGTAISQNGIVIRATVKGTTIATGTAPSSSDVTIFVGGQALSVAFAPASVLRESTDKTLYIQDYSVIVSDQSNNPVKGAVVTLRLRPVAFSLGAKCSPSITYCSEDANGNSSLDNLEDGVRIAIPGLGTDTSVCAVSPLPAAIVTSKDQLLTPQNSMGGLLPASVTTDANGTAAFSLTYLKGSALWIVDKLSATVSASGTESGSSTIFRLPASEVDVKLPDICHLPDSPYLN